MNNPNGAYIVSWDFSRGDDQGVLIVGEQKDGKMTVINAFAGEEAHEIYVKLSTVNAK
jgi:hypothetical protein